MTSAGGENSAAIFSSRSCETGDREAFCGRPGHGVQLHAVGLDEVNAPLERRYAPPQRSCRRPP